MPDAVTIAAILAPAVKNALARVIGSITKEAARASKAAYDVTIANLQVALGTYFTVSYNKCKYFKSLLNVNQPLEVMSNYVHVNLSLGQKTVTDDDFIKSIGDLKYVVIMGLAGSGKSMLMKYLTMSCFEGKTNFAPLFVELRHINSFSQPDLLTYIRTVTAGKSSNVTSEQFEISLGSGSLLLILDGFDEVRHDHRDVLQSQILDIQRNFPAAPIVISSRPDGRFGSWQAFHGYSVDRLSKDQCVELIRGLDYDDGVKKRFEKEVSSRLYRSHTSFLSSPLLTTIMLLTYEDFAEVPDKMHSFYSQAFDTLFQKHDAHKEQFQRKTHTGLTRVDFKAAVAAFSAFSYIEQKFSFDDDALLKSARTTIAYMRQSNDVFSPTVTPEHFISDLSESVCLLQKDGLETTFVHRSFQEYFAAYFVTNSHGPTLKAFLDQYCLRWADSVIQMARDMARETIEQEWVLPTIQVLQERLFPNGLPASCYSVFSQIFTDLKIERREHEIYVATSDARPEVVGPVETLARLYPKYLEAGSLLKPLRDLKLQSARKLWCSSKTMLHGGHSALCEFFKKTSKNAASFGILTIEIADADDWWLKQAGYDVYFESLHKNLALISTEVGRRAKKRVDILDTLIPNLGKQTPVNRKSKPQSNK